MAAGSAPPTNATGTAHYNGPQPAKDCFTQPLAAVNRNSNRGQRSNAGGDHYLADDSKSDRTESSAFIYLHADLLIRCNTIRPASSKLTFLERIGIKRVLRISVRVEPAALHHSVINVVP